MLGVVVKERPVKSTIKCSLVIYSTAWQCKIHGKWPKKYVTETFTYFLYTDLVIRIWSGGCKCLMNRPLTASRFGRTVTVFVEIEMTSIKV